jgi:osmotically-inducible protein OsmY
MHMRTVVCRGALAAVCAACSSNEPAKGPEDPSDPDRGNSQRRASTSGAPEAGVHRAGSEANTTVGPPNPGASETPTAERSTQADVATTQTIREAVLADDSLSFRAKNVKVVTSNGKVTLRGMVESDDERNAIDAQARKVAGSTSVDDELVVKE